MELSSNASAFLLLCFDELACHAGKRLFHVLAGRDVLCKDENSSNCAVRGSPRTNLPPRPTGGASRFPTVFIGSQSFPLESAAIHLFPAVGHFRRKLPR